MVDQTKNGDRLRRWFRSVRIKTECDNVVWQPTVHDVEFEDQLATDLSYSNIWRGAFHHTNGVFHCDKHDKL